MVTRRGQSKDGRSGVFPEAVPFSELTTERHFILVRLSLAKRERQRKY